MWFIVTFNSRTNTTINTSYYYFVKPHTEPTSDTFHPLSQITTFVPCNHADSPPPPVGTVLQPQPHAALCFAGSGWERRSAPHAVSSPVVGERLRPYCLLQWHDIQTTTFHRSNGLCHSAAPDILDVECTNGGPGRGGRRRGGGGVYQT